MCQLLLPCCEHVPVYSKVVELGELVTWKMELIVIFTYSGHAACESKPK